ncbi:TPA: hypothetical protein LA462_002279 [Clostridium botulinum]|nr:hypothetical protein [Clostridium botulinum]
MFASFELRGYKEREERQTRKSGKGEFKVSIDIKYSMINNKKKHIKNNLVN